MSYHQILPMRYDQVYTNYVRKLKNLSSLEKSKVWNVLLMSY